jgi:hypothetical protein
MTSEPESKIK